jgi:hypothetical protein
MRVANSPEDCRFDNNMLSDETPLVICGHKRDCHSKTRKGDIIVPPGGIGH